MSKRALGAGLGCPGRWGSRCPHRCWGTVEMWHLGAWLSGDEAAVGPIFEVFSSLNGSVFLSVCMVVMGGHLDLAIFEVFSDLNDS